jgi:UDP-glucose 4-epimerase
VVLDNLSCGKIENIPAAATFVEGDTSDVNLLRDLFLTHKFDAVMHMAASVEVEESVKQPEKYFENNAINTAKLLSAMDEAGIRRLVFSSTAAVYGHQEKNPISESAPLRPNNPYGYSKLLAERIVRYYCNYLGFQAVVFRYFNAAGCDFDGKIKSTHNTHLLPNILDVAIGNKPFITVHGNDYSTADGTGQRDYIHVLDIAAAHVLALENFKTENLFEVYNIGTGRGLSVLEIINAAAETLNKMIPIQVGPRRAGDSATLIADNNKIIKHLGFRPLYSDPDTIVRTAWNQMENSLRS